MEAEHGEFPRWDGEGAANMLGTGFYPITLAEMEEYSTDADKVFDHDEHERLKEFLALHPESGELIAGTGGIRILHWPLKYKRGPRFRVMYFFRDLNMPLYVLALYRPGERIELGAARRNHLADLVNALVKEHSIRWWARIQQSNNSGA
jgi:hypothetical protein